MSAINNIRKNLRFLLLIIILVILIVLFLLNLTADTTIGQISELTDEWTLYYEDGQYQNVDLTRFYETTGINIKKGDTFTLTTTLPDLGYTEFPTLIFKSTYFAYDLYFDGIQIASYKVDRFEDNRFIGSSTRFIPLSTKYAGMQLTIRVYAASDDLFSGYYPPILGSYSDLKSYYIGSKLLPITTGIFMIIFSLAFAFITIIFYYAIPEILNLVYSSILCGVIGVWILCYYNVASLFMNVTYESTLEYTALYCIVPLSYLIVNSIKKHYYDKIFNILAIMSIFLSLFFILLHYLNIVYLDVMLPFYYVLCFIGTIVTIVYIYLDHRDHVLSPSERILLKSLFICILFILAQMISYTLVESNTIVFSNISDNFIPIGGLIFIYAQMYNYFVYITESYARKQEYASLTHLAYADGLTDLANRSMSEKIMAELDATDTDYCILSMDLNGLKDINDKYGHSAGDRYITDFAKILKSNFEPYGTCCRIGGDEFLIIMPNSTSDEIDALISKTRSSLDVLNVLYSEFKRSVACGYAFRHDCPNEDFHSVYLKADERMYAEKKMMHKKLGILTRV